MKPRLRVYGSRLELSVDYGDNHLAYAFPEIRWYKKRKAWVLPLSRRNVEVLEASRHLYDVGPGVDDLLAARAARKPPSPLRGWPQGYRFKTTPMAHQLRALSRASAPAAGRGFAFFHEQGLGKTKTAIDMCCMLLGGGHIDRVLLFHRVSVVGWPREIAKHSPVDWHLWRISSESKKLVYPDTDQPIWAMVGIESMSGVSRFYETALAFAQGGNCAVIIDESSNIKNHKAIRSERITEVAEAADFRYALTGTSVTEGYENLYSQINALDDDILGFSSYLGFRNHFCEMGGYKDKQVVSYRNLDELFALIAPHVDVVEKKDATDLPGKTFEELHVRLSPDQRRAYTELTNELETMMDDELVEVDMILELYLRLQQVTGGFLKDIPFASNAKIEELRALMGELRLPVLIWCHFIPEIEAVCALMKSLGLRWCRYDGSQSATEKDRIELAFQQGEYDVMVCSYAAAFGLNAQRASTAIYYSKTWSRERYIQSTDRIHRLGMDKTQPATYITIKTSGTVEDAIEEALERKGSMAAYAADQLKQRREHGTKRSA